MSAVETGSHPDACVCNHCQRLQSVLNSIPENPYKDIDKMAPRQDYFDDNAYESASDSDTDKARAKKDEAIRQAPYLPRIQVWARDNGPYTLRVGNQWFHCDDLIINGAEYKTGARRSAPSHRSDAAPSRASVYPPRRRPDARREQSYTRTRPNASSNTVATEVSPQSSGESVQSRSHYSPQSMPVPHARPRGHSDKVHYDKERHERRDSGISVGSDATAQPGQLVPYSSSPAQAIATAPAPARPGLDRRPSRQAAAMRSSMRARPGVRRGSSFDVPVRSKGRKTVRFAPPTAA